MLKYLLYVIIAIIILYMVLYNIHPTDHSIVQVPIQHFTFDILYERSPIVIDQPVYDLDDIITKWFNYNSVSPVKEDLFDRWHTNCGKYLIVQNTLEEDKELFLNNPQNTHPVPKEDDRLFSIVLHPKQVVIVPLGWGTVLIEGMRGVKIDDVITGLMGVFVG